MNEIDDFKVRAHRWAERAGIKGDPERIEGMYRIIEYRSKRGGKTCPKCGEHKTIWEFGSDLSRDDALTTWCSDCRAQQKREARRRKRG